MRTFAIRLAHLRVDPEAKPSPIERPAWRENQAVLAEVGSAADFEVVRIAYLGYSNLHRRRRSDAFVGMDANAGASSSLREEHPGARTSGADLGRWAGMTDAQIEAAIAGTGQPVTRAP